MSAYVVVRLYEGTSSSLGTQVGEQSILVVASSSTSSASTTNLMGTNPVTFTGVTFTANKVYRISTGTRTRQTQAYGGSGGYSSAVRSLNTTFYNPGVSAFSVSLSSNTQQYSEITQGGMQVVATTNKAVKIPTSTSGAALEVIGSITATGNITAFSSSDLRLKENIKPISNPIEKVKQINGITFDWKEGYDDIHLFEGKDVGVIAQEIKTSMPEIVGMMNGGYMGVKYEKLTPLLIEAIKDLSKQVDELQEEIKRLK